MLTSDQVHRQQQATERYERAGKTMVQSRPSVLKGCPGCALKSVQLAKEGVEVQRQLELVNRAQLASGSNAGEVHVVSRSSLDYQDPFGAAKVSKKGFRKRFTNQTKGIHSRQMKPTNNDNIKLTLKLKILLKYLIFRFLSCKIS